MTAIDLLERLWMATLAATAALALVGLLRRPWRRAFGAEQACRLWWLPVLALLASQVPHPSSKPVLGPVLANVHWQHVPAVATSPASGVWIPTALLSSWLFGFLLLLTWEIARQWRFMRSLAGPKVRRSEYKGISLLHLPHAGQSPALVGCWRPRIVLPSDFEQRYDDAERALILAHECMHAQRRDLPALLLGVCLRAVLWFHPLAWWGLTSLREDQELACDAALLSRRLASPRQYARALLNSHVSSPRHASLGCAWNHQPVKERITMLKYPRPSLARRASGTLLVSVMGFALVGTVYANTAHQAVSARSTASASHGVIRSVMKKVSVRDAATKVATTAGYVLENPEALSNRAVSFKFRDVDGKKALKLLAWVDGKKAVFTGNHVRFESH